MHSEKKPALARSGSIDSSCFKSCAVLTRKKLRDPAPANCYVAIVKDRGLSWRNGALGLVESRENFVVASSLDHGRCGLVTMANLHGHTQRVAPWKNWRPSRSRIRCWPGTESSSPTNSTDRSFANESVDRESQKHVAEKITGVQIVCSSA
jgi:hypothetical protein